MPHSSLFLYKNLFHSLFVTFVLVIFWPVCYVLVSLCSHILKLSSFVDMFIKIYTVGTSHSLIDHSHSVAGTVSMYTSQFTTWLSEHQHKRYPISARNNSSNAHSLVRHLAARV
jgi:hypothetical protein